MKNTFSPPIKIRKGIIFLSLLLFSLSLAENLLAQAYENQIKINQISEIIAKVKLKSLKTRLAHLSEYQYKYRLSKGLEDKNRKITNIKSTNIYEHYCFVVGKSFCRAILVEENGVPVSQSKIQKTREKVSKEFTQHQSTTEKPDSFGYGITFGSSGINSVWIEPAIYLRACSIFSSSEKVVEGRPTIFLKVGECNIDSEPIEWKKNILFMPKTGAEIWIDKEDEGVTQINIYAKREFSPDADQNKPIITMENVRMPEGYWFVKKIKLETTNKTIFPNLKDNWEYEFFDYKRLRVDVDLKQIKPN